MTKSITKAPEGATARKFKTMSITLKWALRCVLLHGLMQASAIVLAEDAAPATLPPLRIIQGFNHAGEVVIERIGLVVESTETEERIFACE